jgi:hypothetical protein
MVSTQSSLPPFFIKNLVVVVEAVIVFEVADNDSFLNYT